MFVFTAGQVSHPNPNFGKCFTLDVLWPHLTEVPVRLTPYIGLDFGGSFISPSLARQLNFQLDAGHARGEIVFQSYYEDSPSISRTCPLLFDFRLTTKDIHLPYVHFALADLKAHFEVITNFASNHPRWLPFLALWPHPEVQERCLRIPIER